MTGVSYQVAGWAITATFIITLLFPVYSAKIWPWWQRWWGRNVVIMDELFALAIFPSVLAFFFPALQGQLALAWVAIGCVSASGLGVLWRTWMIWRTQQEGAIDDHAAAADDSAESAAAAGPGVGGS